MISIVKVISKLISNFKDFLHNVYPTLKTEKPRPLTEL